MTLTKQQEKDLYDFCNTFFAQGLGFHIVAKSSDYDLVKLKKLYFDICKKNKWENKYLKKK